MVSVGGGDGVSVLLVRHHGLCWCQNGVPHSYLDEGGKICRGAERLDCRGDILFRTYLSPSEYVYYIVLHIIDSEGFV